MVIGYHVIFGAYGFWLPNDPRGSWSDYVGSRELYCFGPATKTDRRTSVAARPHNRAARLAAQQALRRPSVRWNGLQARTIGRAFGESAGRGNVTVWACSILPEHVHLVIARHHCKVEQIVNCFKGAATSYLLAANLHPYADQRQANGKVPHCWAVNSWNVYLNCPEDVERAVRYVEHNPVKEGKQPQRWLFVRRFAPDAF
jgi:REP element-mobilizing transposase RayT